MGFLKKITILSLAILLASCAQKEQCAPVRGNVCNLDTGNYVITVKRGENRLEFTAPDEVRGVAVEFTAEGCFIDTSGAHSPGEDDLRPTDDADEIDPAKLPSGIGPGLAGDTEAPESDAPGVRIPVKNIDPWRDWLVLAYPEDFPELPPITQDGTTTFDYAGASFTLAPDGQCSVTRSGFTRYAVREYDP